MRVLAAEDEEKRFRKKRRRAENDQAEARNGADNARVLPAQSPRTLASREGGSENVGEQITQDGEDHGQPPERADFGDGADVVSEEANQENRDLALQAKEDGVGA